MENGLEGQEWKRERPARRECGHQTAPAMAALLFPVAHPAEVMPSLGNTAEPLWQSCFSLTVEVLKIREAQNTS